MKFIKILLITLVPFLSYSQDTKTDYSAAQLDSIIAGTKKVDIPTHFNSNGDRFLKDIDVKSLVDKIKSGIPSGVDTRDSLSFVNDSLKIEVWDKANNTLITTYYIDDVINKQLVIPSDNSCISTSDEVVIKKSDGSLVSKQNSSFKRNEVYPTGNYTVNTTDQIIYAVGGSTITLPICASNCSEKTIYRDACSDGLITVNVAGGGKIDGVHTSRILQVGRGAFTYECVNGEWRIKSEFFEQDKSCCEYSLSNSLDANVQVWTADGLPYSVDWGDGTNSGLIASGVATSKAYGSPFTGNVKICKTCGVAPIYRVNFNSGNWNFDINDLNCLSGLKEVLIYTGVTTGDIANLPNGLTSYSNQGQNTTTGDIANLPSGLIDYSNYGQNTTYGNIANLPSGLTYYDNQGQNTTTGDVFNLPSGLTYYLSTGQNTTYGDIANLPNGLILYGNSGQNTTSGDIANLPNGLTYYLNGGQNTTYGDIANLPNGLTYYNNQGQNTTYGDIANLLSGLIVYSNQGQNTTTGDIANLPSGLTYYENQGQNSTAGNIANLPVGLTYYFNSGQNTTIGDITNLPSGLIYYSNSGQNIVSDYSGGNLNSGITYFLSIPISGGLSSSEVDDLFIELDSTLPGLGYVNITGTNAAPTAASLAARNNMVANGVTLIHN